MSPQKHEHRQENLAELAEREARFMLDVSWEEASKLLDHGVLAGTSAEAELRMLRFLMER